MNLLLLTDQNLLSPRRARITEPRQVEHLHRVLKVQMGDTLATGLLNGPMGEGKICGLRPDAIELDLQLDQTPPEPLPLTLILSLPRPQQIKRILQTIGAGGVKQLHLIHSRRVEKSYWQSPSVSPEEIEHQLRLGLEQGCDTLMPSVYYHKRFKPFAEDYLPRLIENRLGLVAHPYKALPCPAQVNRDTTVMVGPEGGFNDFEMAILSAAGLQSVHLGPRILKTEVAIPYLLGRLF